MLVNFCTEKFQPKFQCLQMQLEGYHADNLAKDFSRNNGFLTDSLQRPPVDIFIQFPFNIDMKYIYFGPSIGHHRSTLIEFSVNHQFIDENHSWLFESKENKSNLQQMSFVRILQILNEDENIRRIEIYEQNSEHQSNNNQTAQYRFSSNRHLMNCSTIKITIKRTYRLSACALKYLQIWGIYSESNSFAIKTKLQTLISPPPPSSVSSSESPSDTLSSRDIPSDFFDELTNELMIIPMLLPSGHLIDRTSLEKCTTEDLNWSRLPRDPFTLESFTDHTQPIVAQQLKIRIDQFLSEHQNDSQYSHHRRLLDARKPIENRDFVFLKRKLSIEEKINKRT